LTFLKLGGAVTQKLFDHVHGFNPVTGDVARLASFTRISRPLAQQLGMLTGIASGHYFESMLGKRPKVTNDTLWTDSLVTLLQFNIGGHLSQQVMGPRYASLMQEMALRTQDVETKNSDGKGPRFSEVLGTFMSGLGGGEVAVTPDGVRIPLHELKKDSRAQDLNVLMSGKDDDSEVGSEKPGQIIDLFSSMPPRPPPTQEELKSSVKNLLPLYLSNDVSHEQRRDFGAELYEYLPLVKESIFEIMAEDEAVSQPISERWLTSEKAANIPHTICKDHFEKIGDELLAWSKKFDYLRAALLDRLHSGTREDREATQKLFNKVERKFLESGRYYHDVESYLGDDKGPGPKSFFNEDKYPTIMRLYRYHLGRFKNYLAKKPELKELLQDYKPDLAPRYQGHVDRDEVIEDLNKLQKVGLSGELAADLIEVLLNKKIFISSEELFPFSRMLKCMIEGISSEKFLVNYRALRQYLEALAGLRQYLSAKQIQDLRLYPWRSSPAEVDEAIHADFFRWIPETKNTTLGQKYLHALEKLVEVLEPFKPPQRGIVQPSWEDMRSQLERRNFLTLEAMKTLLHWCDRDESRPNNPTIYATRGHAVAGMIDFIFKDTHSEAIRSEIICFIEEVLQRRDERMMEVIMITFQNYRLGMMRDRRKSREKPSADPLSDEMDIEAHDHFLETLRNTAKFYHEHSGIRGAYLEIIEKIGGGPKDDYARLAFPVLHQTQRYLQQGYEVDLMRRSSLGEAVLQVRHPEQGEKIIAVTSILSGVQRNGKIRPAVEERLDLEERLSQAENSLLNNVEYAHLKNGGHPLILSIQIPSIKSGLAKTDVRQWARDYLENHPKIAEIHLELPHKGSVAPDPMNGDYFEHYEVSRSAPTTEALITNLEMEVEKTPDLLDLRLELYRLRKGFGPSPILTTENWALLKDTYARFPTINAVKVEFQQALDQIYKGLRWEKKEVLLDESGELIGDALDKTTDFLNAAIGTSLSGLRYKRLIDMSPSPFMVSRLEFNYSQKEGVKFSGEIHPPEGMKERLFASEGSKQNPLKEKEGHFSFHFDRHPKTEILRAHFGRFKLPKEMRGYGVDAIFFSEFVRLCHEMKIPLIFVEDADGKHAELGVQFLDSNQRDTVRVHFIDFVEYYLHKNRMKNYDLSALWSIQNPQQVVYAYLDPKSRIVCIPQDITQIDRGSLFAQLQPGLLIGRQFFRDRREYNYQGFFDPSQDSLSSTILSKYIKQLFQRIYPHTYGGKDGS
jgi:hypothetical protein